MELSKDSAILLSFLNLKLRDVYPSWDALCDDLGIDADAAAGQMFEYGYIYDEAQNRFVPK